jgi:hypothetical protein
VRKYSTAPFSEAGSNVNPRRLYRPLGESSVGWPGGDLLAKRAGKIHIKVRSFSPCCGEVYEPLCQAPCVTESDTFANPKHYWIYKRPLLIW